MDKIYRRATQLGNTPKKKKDEKKRKRNVIMNFRVSPEEKEMIDTRIEMTGLSKSDFFIDSCMHQKIFVQGNIKSFSSIKERMKEIADALNRNPNLEDLDEEKLSSLKTILEILDRLFGPEK